MHCWYLHLHPMTILALIITCVYSICSVTVSPLWVGNIICLMLFTSPCYIRWGYSGRMSVQEGSKYWKKRKKTYKQKNNGLEPPRTGLCGVWVASLHCVHLADPSASWKKENIQTKKTWPTSKSKRRQGNPMSSNLFRFSALQNKSIVLSCEDCRRCTALLCMSSSEIWLTLAGKHS